MPQPLLRGSSSKSDEEDVVVELKEVSPAAEHSPDVARSASEAEANALGIGANVGDTDGKQESAD